MKSSAYTHTGIHTLTHTLMHTYTTGPKFTVSSPVQRHITIIYSINIYKADKALIIPKMITCGLDRQRL